MEKDFIKKEFKKIEEIKVDPNKINKEIFDLDKASAEELKQYRDAVNVFKKSMQNQQSDLQKAQEKLDDYMETHKK